VWIALGRTAGVGGKVLGTEAVLSARTIKMHGNALTGNHRLKNEEKKEEAYLQTGRTKRGESAGGKREREGGGQHLSALISK